jgi:hypothetical protein
MKPEVVFGLENAAWPAVLVNAGGAVLMFNTAAKMFSAGAGRQPGATGGHLVAGKRRGGGFSGALGKSPRRWWN